MILRRQIGARIVAVALLACLVGALGALAAGLVAGRELSLGRVGELAAELGRRQAREACARDEFAFIGAGDLRFRTFARDGRALAGGPDLPPELRLQDGVQRLGWRPTRVLFRVADAGPCAWVEASWSPRAGSIRLFWLTVVAATMPLLALVVWLVRRLVAKPLLDRLEALRVAAGAIGSEPFRGAPAFHDEMDTIGEALERADRAAKERVAREVQYAQDLDAFVAEVAHDVRTPLASLSLALDEVAEDASERALPTLTRALNDVVYLTSLVQNLRLTGRLREGLWPSDEQQQLELGALVQRVVLRAQPFALRRGIALQVQREPVPRVRASEVATEQALANLVENAILHGSAGNEVRITLRAAEAIELAVDDDGPGISDAELARLVAPDENTARTRYASGLGLRTTRAVAERTGWTLRFARSERGGLRASVLIPLDTSATVRAHSS